MYVCMYIQNMKELSLLIQLNNADNKARYAKGYQKKIYEEIKYPNRNIIHNIIFNCKNKQIKKYSKTFS